MVSDMAGIMNPEIQGIYKEALKHHRQLISYPNGNIYCIVAYGSGIRVAPDFLNNATQEEINRIKGYYSHRSYELKP